MQDRYWLTRFLFLRALGFIYFLGFFSFLRQGLPLIGENGLLPVQNYLSRLEITAGSKTAAFLQVPTLFWLDASDSALLTTAWIGVGLSILLMSGLANAIQLALLWALYLSIAHVGQLFYGYGWEMMLLEGGFLATFLVPILNPKPFPEKTPPPSLVFWLFRWMLFRIMVGAGLIKLRGDPCWLDLTCLEYHHETQPIPNPVSWYLHQFPAWLLKVGVLWNHFIELIVPFFLFGRRRLRQIAGLLLILFQGMLIVGGNLSWLNYLTIALTIPCFDDQLLGKILPKKWRLIFERLGDTKEASRTRRWILRFLVVLVIALSISPALNLLSSRQAMNRSFDPLHLVNTYGAFGSVGKIRPEIILEGTDEERIGETTRWQPYEFKCKPGKIDRRPCIISPYHYRLDWQIWFAAMSDYRHNPWFVHFVAKLLAGDPGTLSLLEENPFKFGPPQWIRAELYEYRFTRFGDPSGTWWKRARVGPYLPPLSLNDPHLQAFLAQYGWKVTLP